MGAPSWGVGQVDTIDEALDLERVEPAAYRAVSLRDVGEGAVVFGGQIAAQMVMAGSGTVPDKVPRQVHVQFVRAVSRRAPFGLDVEVLQDGRTFASAAVSAVQDGRLMARGTVMLDAPDDEVIRHVAPIPDVDPPESCPTYDGYRTGDAPDVVAGRHQRVVADFHPGDPDVSRPARLHLWARASTLGPDPARSAAFVALASAGPNITVSMLPHVGAGTDLAHDTISTGILSHTVTFVQECDAHEWLLFEHEVPAAGGGRIAARGSVFSPGRGLVAVFCQSAMVRHPRPPASGSATQAVL